MQSLFRARLPQQLTLVRITNFSSEWNLSPREIEKWYERFVHCYTSGFVSFGEFQIYIKQLYVYHGNQQNQLSKGLIKQLFQTLDVDKDQGLNFEEFFRFNLLVNQGSAEDKLKFILNLYTREKEIRFTQQEIEIIVISMSGILDMAKSRRKLSENIDQILKHINLNNRIGWNTFSTSILNQSDLFQLLLANPVD